MPTHSETQALHAAHILCALVTVERRMTDLRQALRGSTLHPSPAAQEERLQAIEGNLRALRDAYETAQRDLEPRKGTAHLFVEGCRDFGVPEILIFVPDAEVRGGTRLVERIGLRNTSLRDAYEQLAETDWSVSDSAQETVRPGYYVIAVER